MRDEGEVNEMLESLGDAEESDYSDGVYDALMWVIGEYTDKEFNRMLRHEDMEV